MSRSGAYDLDTDYASLDFGDKPKPKPAEAQVVSAPGGPALILSEPDRPVELVISKPGRPRKNW